MSVWLSREGGRERKDGPSAPDLQSARRRSLRGDPLTEWKMAAKILPYMAILARKLPATSAPAERLFSSAGNTQTKKRNRLNCDNLEKLVYLHENWPLVREWNMKAILKD